MFVLIVDQKRARRGVDRVDQVLADLNRAPLLRPFERTTGDEIQGVSDNPRLVVTMALDMIRRKHWSVGIGVGSVELPLPVNTRAGRGHAFDAARLAVEEAKSVQVPVAVVGEPGRGATAESAQAALTLTGLIVARRSPQGQAAVGLMDRGMSQTEVAELLGITKQAVSQRLTHAAWQPEAAGRMLCERLLRDVDKSG